MVENYQAAVADTENFWECHHRLEIQGPFVNSPELLEKCGMYTNVPAWQLIFLTRAEHNKLHNTGKKLSEETRAKISSSCKGWKPSAESRAKMSAAHIGKKHSEETRAKISAAKSGENHHMFGKHHSENTRAKIGASSHGRHWFNNGTETKFCKECPGPGWKRGRLKH